MKTGKNLTNLLTLIIGLSGFLVIGLGALIKENGTGSEFEYYVEMMLLISGFFLWGCVGIVWIARREAPQVIQVKGKPAIIIGLLLVISTWSMVFYGFYLAILRFLS